MVEGRDYELIAASQTDQILGDRSVSTVTGQVLERLVIVPETTGPGLVAIQDGSGTAINVYTGGTVSAELQPIIVPLGVVSVTGSWQITTGVNVHVIAVGKFN
jgi:hypothetical protein